MLALANLAKNEALLSLDVPATARFAFWSPLESRLFFFLLAIQQMPTAATMMTTRQTTETTMLLIIISFSVVGVVEALRKLSVSLLSGVGSSLCLCFF